VPFAVDVQEAIARARERHRRALGDLDAQRVGQILLDVDPAHPSQAAEVALHALDVDLEEIQPDVALRDEIDGFFRRVHHAGDLDLAHRVVRTGLRVPPRPHRAAEQHDHDERVAQSDEQTLHLNAALIAAQPGHVGRAQEA
jgi:hypothetical protein